MNAPHQHHWYGKDFYYSNRMSPREMALRLTAVQWHAAESRDGAEGGAVMRLDVRSIFARPRSKQRTEEFRRMLSQGADLPLPQVAGLRCSGRATFYSTMSGHDAIVIAKEARKSKVLAEVSGWYTCQPRQFILCRGVISPIVSLYTRKYITPYKSIGKFLTPDLMRSLREIGVEYLPDDAQSQDFVNLRQRRSA